MLALVHYPTVMRLLIIDKRNLYFISSNEYIYYFHSSAVNILTPFIPPHFNYNYIHNKIKHMTFNAKTNKTTSAL